MKGVPIWRLEESSRHRRFLTVLRRVIHDEHWLSAILTENLMQLN